MILAIVMYSIVSVSDQTDLYRLYNSSLTVIRYKDEILGPIVRPYTGAVVLGSSWCTTGVSISGESTTPPVVQELSDVLVHI